jgi:glycosyltransferase involved in cell wall biosynthesis
MKVLLLANPLSPHTEKWVAALCENGIDVGIFGINDYGMDSSVRYSDRGIFNEIIKLKKDCGIRYFSVLPRLFATIKQFKPDILHAHYATGYGLLGALSGFHPYLISVWGSDIFDFPNKSPLHNCLLRFNLSRADRVLSTSHAMAKETSNYTKKHIDVTPFGVDLSLIQKASGANVFQPGDIVVGTVKTLEDVYGIDTLIKAFALVKNRNPALPLKLLIVGRGSQEQALREMAGKLGVGNDTHFTGYVPHGDVWRYHNALTVAVFLSNRESFGVSALEAAACGKPVVASAVGGLPEIVADGVSGYLVPPGDPAAAAERIEMLVLDEKLRLQMGKAGKGRVCKHFDWKNNSAQMIEIYQSVIIN